MWFIAKLRSVLLPERELEKLCGTDLGEGDTGMIVDTDVDELPADATAVALAGPISRDAVADCIVKRSAY